MCQFKHLLTDFSRELAPHLFQVAINSTDLSISQTLYNVSKVIVHPQFTSAPTLRHDLALLKLNSDLDIAPICLSEGNARTSAVCYTVGWGSVDGRGTINPIFCKLSKKVTVY